MTRSPEALSDFEKALRACSVAEQRALFFEPVGPPLTEYDPRAGSLAGVSRVVRRAATEEDGLG